MVDFVPDRAVIDAVHRKWVKYEAKCADIGYGFLPFSFSLLGELEKDAVILLNRIRMFSVTQDIEAHAPYTKTLLITHLRDRHCNGEAQAITKHYLLTDLVIFERVEVTLKRMGFGYVVFVSKHTLRVKCRHDKGSFVSPPDSGDGVVRFVLYDLTKPQVSSCSLQINHVEDLLPDQHGGFTLALLNSLFSKSLFVLPLYFLKTFCPRSNVECESSIKRQRQEESIVNAIRSWSVSGGSLQLVREVLAESSPLLLNVDEEDLDLVLDKIKSFPRGTSCGRDGLSAHHLLDCLSGAVVAISDELVSSITQVVNLFLEGKCPKILGGYIASAPLTPLVKPGGGIRPIAMIYSSVSGGGEAILHVVNRLIEDRGDDVGLSMLLMDFKYAFNLVDREDDPLGPLLFALVLHLLICKIRDSFSLFLQACSKLVMKRVVKTIKLMDADAKINDPQSLRSALERIVTATGPGFGDWQWRLATLPFAFGGLDTMNGKTYRCVLCYRLGVPLFSVSKPCSACSRVFTGDIYGNHVVSCVGIIVIKHRHNVVHDTLVDICFRLGIWAGKEVDIGLGGGRSSPLTQTGLTDFLPGRAVVDAAHRKRVNYGGVGICSIEDVVHCLNEYNGSNADLLILHGSLRFLFQPIRLEGSTRSIISVGPDLNHGYSNSFIKSSEQRERVTQRADEICNKEKGSYTEYDRSMILQVWWVQVAMYHVIMDMVLVVAWFFYKESSWIKTIVFANIMFWIGSFGTCAYIVFQLFMLSEEEASKDPIYFVLARRQKGNNVMGHTNRHFVTIAKVIVAGIGCYTLGVIIYAIVIDGSPLDAQELTP
nr:auxilin-like protein [Tanacetum cinerariifolium]